MHDFLDDLPEVTEERKKANAIFDMMMDRHPFRFVSICFYKHDMNYSTDLVEVTENFITKTFFVSNENKNKIIYDICTIFAQGYDYM